jgi:hypothetical protein
MCSKHACMFGIRHMLYMHHVRTHRHAHAHEHTHRAERQIIHVLRTTIYLHTGMHYTSTFTQEIVRQ